jgi:hypothetical protein
VWITLLLLVVAGQVQIGLVVVVLADSVLAQPSLLSGGSLILLLLALVVQVLPEGPV